MSGGAPRTRPTFKHRLSLALAAVLSQVYRVLPLTVAYRVADVAGDLVFRLLPTYRANVASNISHVLGPATDRAEVMRVTRRVFRTSARNFTDMLRVPSLSTEDVISVVAVSDASWRHLDEAIAEQRGVILLTAHFGAFDFVGQLLTLSGYDVTGLVTRTVPEFIDTAVSHLRASRGFKMEQATPGGVRRVMGRLKRGGIVALLNDRDFFQNGRAVVFFGRETTLPPGPARIARDTGAAIVPVVALRRKRGYELAIEPGFHVEATDDVDRDVDVALARIVGILERNIRRSPDQWVMFQRVWPERPAAALRVFPVGSPLEGEILGRGATPEGPLTRPAEPPTDRMDSQPSPSPERSRRRAMRPE